MTERPGVLFDVDGTLVDTNYLEIWRYQDYVEHPVMARSDAREYGALRKWARQFYDIEPAQHVGRS